MRARRWREHGGGFGRGVSEGFRFWFPGYLVCMCFYCCHPSLRTHTNSTQSKSQTLYHCILHRLGLAFGIYIVVRLLALVLYLLVLDDVRIWMLGCCGFGSCRELFDRQVFRVFWSQRSTGHSGVLGALCVHLCGRMGRSSVNPSSCFEVPIPGMLRATAGFKTG